MKTKILIYILFGVLMASCSEDFMELTNPNAKTSADFWQTEEDLNKAMTTVYWAATNNNWGAYFGVFFWCIDETRDEYYENYSGSSVNTYTNTANDNGFNWACNYQGIFFANQIIKYGGNMNIDASVKNKYVAEAKFLRGLFYFTLYNEWGAVPIYTEPATTDLYKAKSTKEEVWQQVINDFTESSQLLPETRPASETGRVTKGTALAYLGRAYLYHGQANDWVKAQETLKSIVDKESTYGYGLVDNYADLFDGKHENSKEAIFEIQMANIGGGDVWDVNANRNLTTPMGQLWAPSEVGGWNAVGTLNPALLQEFLKESATTTDGIDPRAKATLAWNYPGCVFYTHPFNGFFDTNKVYVRKWANNTQANEGEYKSEIDYYGMRYADVLLMLAEAYTMQGKVAEAAPLVNRIRERAKLPNKLSAMQTYSQDQMMTEIRHQRNLEFTQESLHFYDMRRWGLLKDAMKNVSLNKFKQTYIDNWPKYDYLPIPQSELSANKNMTQNAPW